MRFLPVCATAFVFWIGISHCSRAEQLASGGGEALAATTQTSGILQLQVPDGFTIELVAGPPLVERPIAATFDELGRLYVAESSGSNDPVAKQLELRPHRIARLEDQDGDGKFDQRIEFADQMMLPQGVLFFDGSLYVAAPPSIWKLTDTNDDGVADQRTEWYQGKTLTGCANDLHGPFLGPDGWIYWTKGGFAEQTHMIRGREWKSRAAHIFRCRTDGTDMEPVITGGMDNPVDIVFTPEGELILSATLLVGQGRRDGLVHAIYGGVYGKEHGVLEGHPRTGELMPVMSLMNPVAPCGVERYDSEVFGPEFRHNLFLCQFNLRKVSRHVLTPDGSTLASVDSDFVTSEHVDFHPTDVLMDADGSLLVVDTGGWYKLCCPTSQLWKPDVLGGIYRVRRAGAVSCADPRGQKIAWDKLNIGQLWALLADGRSAVRQRALQEFVERRDSGEMRDFLGRASQGVAELLGESANWGAVERGDPQTATLQRAWALVQVETVEARLLVRQLLDHPDEQVRHVGLRAVGLNRDLQALPQLMTVLRRDTAANRRAAAEAIGRLGDQSAVPHLLSAAAHAEDRILQHSIVYALIELGDAAATRAGLTSNSPATHAAALIALDQMPGGGADAAHVIGLLDSSEDELQQAAHWIVKQHPAWGAELANWFRQRLVALADMSELEAKRKAELGELLVSFVSDGAIQKVLADVVCDSQWPPSSRDVALRVMAMAKLREPPTVWRTALASALSEPRLVESAIAAARAMPASKSPDDALNQALLSLAESSKASTELRVAALAVVSGSMPQLSGSQFELLVHSLATDGAATLRSAAATALANAPLSQSHLRRLCEVLRSVGPLELNQLLTPFARVSDEPLGLRLVASLREADSLASLRVDLLREALANYGPRVKQEIDALEAELNVDASAQRKRIEELLPLVAQGDVRRGHAVFHSSKAACSVCHRLGYAGGTTGPELSSIGQLRTERDLLESILYPSLSLVRGYEPVLVITQDGRAINGVIRDETSEGYLLATGPDQEVRLSREEVAEIAPSTISIMPAGLEKQLSVQELADLVAFLKIATAQERGN